MDILQSLTANEYFGMNLGTEIFPKPSFGTYARCTNQVSDLLVALKMKQYYFLNILALNAIANGLVLNILKKDQI